MTLGSNLGAPTCAKPLEADFGPRGEQAYAQQRDEASTALLTAGNRTTELYFFSPFGSERPSGSRTIEKIKELVPRQNFLTKKF